MGNHSDDEDAADADDINIDVDNYGEYVDDGYNDVNDNDDDDNSKYAITLIIMVMICYIMAIFM